MKISILTVYPEMYDLMHMAVVGKALERQAFDLDVVNIRDFSADKHHRTDDYPFGGGAGMVMTCQPIHDAIQSVDPEHRYRRILMSPRGRTFDQQVAKELADLDGVILVCGSFEGVDERVIEADIDEEMSIGDYVLTSGDLAAMVIVNAVVRHLPGVLGSEESTAEESFGDNLLEYPQYTRPSVWEGREVPEVLLSGNHANIARWRREMSYQLTKERRPDLLTKK